MQRAFCFFCFLSAAVSVVAAEKNAPHPNDLFGKLRVRLLDQSGVELKSVDVEEARPSGLERQRFQFKDKEIDVLSCVDPVSKTVVYRIDSPEFGAGAASVGIQFPKENRLPKLGVEKNRATFEGKRGKILLGWTAAAILDAPQSRKELNVSLAEYGATDRWADVTETVRELIVGDVLDFRAGNALFGDPAGGVVKSLVLNYSLDDDEKIETFAENQIIRIQYDPKDRFYRLNAEKSGAFEFVVGLDKLPETLPSFEEAQKHAASIGVPKSH